MAVLHIVRASRMLRPCLGRVRAGDAILLIGDGVYAALRECEACGFLASAVEEGVGVFCIGPDLDARGIAPEQLLEHLEWIDYGGFVDLTVRFTTCSW